MPAVSFSPLFSFDIIKKTPGILSRTASGVYVWGFKFKNPEDPSGLTPFLPYCAGKADGTTIIQKLTSYYNFKGNYNVFKEKYLHVYFNYLESDATVKYCSPEQYAKYKERFAYLKTGNIESGELGNYGKAFNQLQKRRSNTNIASAIQYYQDNFYACWIIVPANGKNPMITSLDRHIGFHLPHPYIGTSKAEHNSLFEINEEELGDDRFLL